MPQWPPWDKQYCGRDTWSLTRPLCGLRGSQPSIFGLNIPDEGERYHGLPAAQHCAQVTRATENKRQRREGEERQLDGGEPAEEGHGSTSATVQGCPGYSGLIPPNPVHFFFQAQTVPDSPH